MMLGTDSPPDTVYRRDRMQLPTRLQLKRPDRRRFDRGLFPSSIVSDFPGFGGGGP